MTKGRIYRIAILLSIAFAAGAIMFRPGMWPSVSGLTGDCSPVASGTSTSEGPSAGATLNCPPPTPSPSPSDTPSQNSPGGGGSGGGPAPATPITQSQPCPQPSPLGSTTTINPVVGLTPGGPITNPSGPVPCLGMGILYMPGPPTALTMATSPPPNLAPYVAQAFEQIVTSPGTITAAPPNHTGLVNLPQCYWLTGQSVPGTKTVTMDLKGAPNAAEKQITYHISLTVSFDKDKTVWNFGDGSQQTTNVPIPCIGDSGGASSLVAHNYLNYSQNQPSGVFNVTASETYDVSATMSWVDDTGPQSQNVTLNGNTTTMATAPYPVRIDQEEGVGS